MCFVINYLYKQISVSSNLTATTLCSQLLFNSEANIVRINISINFMIILFINICS
jgi:hypothetical protein